MKLLLLIGVIAAFVNTTTSWGSVDGDLASYPLTMTSVMLHHRLTWPLPEAKQLMDSTIYYRVWYGHLFDEDKIKWYELLTCRNITVRHCEIDKGPFRFTDDMHYAFYVDGRAQKSKEIVYTTKTIIFNAFEEMYLVPPKLSMRFHDDFLFLYPERQYHWDGSSIENVAELEGIVYQIEYWRENNIHDVQNITTEKLDREILIPVEHPEEYCAMMRLYIEEAGVFTPRTVFSNWSSPPVCAKPLILTTSNIAINNPPTSQEAVKYTCIGIGCLVVLVILSYFAYKARKIRRFINEKTSPPDILMTIFQDSPQPCSRSQGRERIDLMALEFADAILPSRLSHQRKSFEDFQRIYEQDPLTRDTPLLRLNDGNVSDEDLHFEGTEQPVFDDEPSSIENMPLNTTYGIDAINICHQIEERVLGESENYFPWASFCERMDIPQSLFSTASSDAAGNRFGNGVLTPTLSRKLPTVSTSSFGSNVSLIFDIERSKDPAKNNFYFGGNPMKSENSKTERLNFAYSSNPKRDMPDIIFHEYMNEP